MRSSGSVARDCLRYSSSISVSLCRLKFTGDVVRNQCRSRSGSTIELHGALVETSKSPLFWAASQAADSSTTCLTLRPICRHWSISQMPTGS